MHKEYFQNDEQKIELVCCYLNKNTEHLKKNGISRYIQFLNDSMYSSGSSKKKLLGDIDQSFKENIVPLVPKFSANTKRVCKTTSCYEYAVESQEYSGYCEKCYRQEKRDEEHDRKMEREKLDFERFQELNKKLDLERQNELDRLEAINRKLKLDRQNDLEFFQKMEMNKMRSNDANRTPQDIENKIEAAQRKIQLERLDLIEKQAEFKRGQEAYKIGKSL